MDKDAALYDTSWSCTNGKDGTGLVTSSFSVTKDECHLHVHGQHRPPPVVAVAKTPDPQLIFEPGGQVTFTVNVSNLGNDAVTLDLARRQRLR